MIDVSLKTSQVAALLGCCERTVLRMCERGQLRPARFGVGRQRRYSLADVRLAAGIAETKDETENVHMNINSERLMDRESTVPPGSPST